MKLASGSKTKSAAEETTANTTSDSKALIWAGAAILECLALLTGMYWVMQAPDHWTAFVRIAAVSIVSVSVGCGILFTCLKRQD